MTDIRIECTRYAPLAWMSRITGALFGLSLVELYGPADQHVWVNPNEVVTVREPLRRDGFAAGARCVVTLTNGNLISTVESCEVVIKRLR